MATQEQYNTTIQPYRNLNIKLEVLDYDYYIIDEISGLVETANFSINADSDIRRTCSISMQLKDDWSEDPLYISEYWKAGNPFWFDKYLRINIGIEDVLSQEYIWSNQGIYLINEPSVSYNATDNTLSFQAVDLMAKFTGLRNGNLEGLEYVIEAGSSIREAMTSLIQEQGFQQYIILDPPQAITPYEIRISAGGTSYDLLSELRDINPNWEMFFDVDGTFYFKEIANEETIALDKITPIIDNDTTEQLIINYQLNTSFEDVKNYIEVYGGLIEATHVTSLATVSSNTLSLTFNELTNMNDGDVWFLGFSFSEASVPIDTIKIYADNNLISTLDTSVLPLKYNNWDYRIKVAMNSGVKTFEYLGYAQPYAVIWEDNFNSPFFVGESINGVEMNSPTDAINFPFSPLPLFRNQVRVVLSGGEYDNIYSNQLAIDRAKYELYSMARRQDSIQIEWLPVYWLDANQLIEYKLPNEDKMSYWLIKEISTDFGVSGTQTINATRQYI